MLTHRLLLIGLVEYSLAQSGNEFVDALVAHLRVSPSLVHRLNTTIYRGTLQVQEQLKISNITAENLLNLRRVRNATVKVDAFGELHLRTSLLVSNIIVRAAYSYHSWLTLKGIIGLRISALTMDVHATLENLTSMTLKKFRVRDVSSPRVTDFTGASALFNWLGARSVEMLMADSTRIIVENIENFAHKGISTVMMSEKRCLPTRNYVAVNLTGETTSELDWIDNTGLHQGRIKRVDVNS